MGGQVVGLHRDDVGSQHQVGGRDGDAGFGLVGGETRHGDRHLVAVDPDDPVIVKTTAKGRVLDGTLGPGNRNSPG